MKTSMFWLLPALLLLGACGLTPQGNLVATTVHNAAETVAVTAEKNTRAFYCALPYSMFLKKFGTSHNGATVVHQFCAPSVSESLLEAEGVNEND